jgi:N-acetylglucosamine-6-phosphate deacetylase
MSAAGAPPGNYRLGPLDIAVGDDGIAREPGGQFAGSTLVPSRGVALTARFLGISSEEARRLWSEAPARAFGLPAGTPPAFTNE